MVFADAVYWIAMTRRREQLHGRAVRWQTWLAERGTRIITTEAVLWEWLNTLADPRTRRQAADGYRLCHEDAGVEVVPLETPQLRAAFTLYCARPDKAWSLTDCHSFNVMQQHRMTAALTSDHHFTQAGFRALLLEEPPT